MRILALDLGTDTGFALEDTDGYPLACGTWKLATPSELRKQRLTRGDRRGDRRFGSLFMRLNAVCTGFRPNLIVFEDVQFASTSMQAHLWASLRAAVWMMEVLHDIQIDCCPVATLKKFATGSGAADKDAMASYLSKNPRFSLRGKKIFDTVTNTELDDNAVDAIHLLNWAKSLMK